MPAAPVFKTSIDKPSRLAFSVYVLAPQNRKILHIDMDCFYAAVEVRDNPDLRGRPVAVGGRPGGRGVIATSNYEARKFGVRSAQSVSQALRLCPQLALVPAHFSKYKNESRKIRNIFEEFTDCIQPLSLDEAYLDVTESDQFSGSATLIAHEIRQRIFQRTQLTASAGIAPNKFLAKVACEWNKPNGQFTLSPKNIPDFVAQLKIEAIPGVGKVTKEKMHKLKIYHCKDLQALSLEKLSHHFGSWGYQLYNMSRGIDHRPVNTSRVRKSLSVERTFAQDLQSIEEGLQHLKKIYEEFLIRLEKLKNPADIKSLIVKIKFHDFQSTTIEKSKHSGLHLSEYQKLFEEAYYREAKPMRLIGLGVKLKNTDSPQSTLSSTPQMNIFDLPENS